MLGFWKFMFMKIMIYLSFFDIDLDFYVFEGNGDFMIKFVGGFDEVVEGMCNLWFNFMILKLFFCILNWYDWK